MASDFKQGIIQPSLIDGLRSILDQYPDDNQILKELIQNAEDAGASEVKFVYDTEFFSTERLHHPGLADYQGPALLAYNNAIFTETDWTSVRMLQNSLKKEDPMKVGRFGLGFKSVFHMTDLPGILSGNQLGFLDPHESFFEIQKGNRTQRTSSYAWEIQEATTEIPDQLQPFCQNLFGNIKNHYFPGTLLRFPLRCKDQDSEISKTVYDETKIRQLFEALQKEAHSFLLFLTNIESIEVYEKRASTEPKLVYAVRIDDSVLKGVRAARKRFKDAISGCTKENPWLDIAVCECFKLQTTHESHSTRDTKHWIVTHYFDDGHNHGLRDVSVKGRSKMLPWVGIAHPIEKNIEKTGGQIFAFLPLPIEEESATGFHFHVHGYFAVEQNRRHIKWTAYQGQPTDYEREWNSVLLSVCLPKALRHTVLYCIFQKLRTEDIYRLLPSSQTIKVQWKTMLEGFYRAIEKDSVIRSFHNEWVSADIAYYIEGSNDAKDVIKKIFISSKRKYHLVDIPDNLYRSLNNKPDKVTPDFMRKMLQDFPTEELTRDERFQLLRYFHNVNSTGLMNDLRLCEFEHGLCPFTNECFIISTQLSSNIRKLCPGLRHKFHVTVDDKYYDILVQIAKSDGNNLRVITEYDVPELLGTMLPHTCMTLDVDTKCGSTTYRLSREWLLSVWEHMGKYPHLVPDLENLPVLLSGVRLFTLSKQLPLLKQGYCEELYSALRNIELILIENTNLQHIDDFVKPISANSVLEQLSKVTDAAKRVGILGNTDKLQLRELFCEVGKKHTCLGVLRVLPLFDRLKKTKEFMSANEAIGGYQYEPFVSLNNFTKIVDLREQNCLHLAELLGIHIMSEKELIVQHIFPHFNEYNEDEKNEIVHKALSMHKDNDIKAIFKESELISTQFHGRKSPQNLVNPKNDWVLQLYMKTQILPLPDQRFQDELTLARLTELGMPGEDGITAKHVYDLACFLDNHSKDTNEMYAKQGHTLVKFLNNNLHRLKKDYVLDHGVQTPLFEALKSKAFVPYLKLRPKTYDQSLPWFKSAKILLPPIGLTVHFELTGSTLGTVEEMSSDIGKIFRWCNKPDLKCVVKHLDNIIHSYRENCEFPSCLLKIYEYLSAHSTSEVNEALHAYCNNKWIWHGNGFASCADMTLDNKLEIDLSPYIYVCPRGIKRFKDLFLTLGMKINVNGFDLLEQIKRRVEESTETKYNERDLNIVISILTKLIEEYSKKQETFPCNLLVPVESSEKLVLLPATECTYCDSEWLREDNALSDDIIKTYNIVHPKIPPAMAKCFKIPSYKNRFLDAENLEIEGFGQSEPLTRRIHNILDDYKDGSSILKELIQNADDAGASEVAFIYDTRDYTTTSRSLLDTAMKSLQGPAIWAYNNATFSDVDFKNIVRLSGGTKKNETNKIGRFGLGFNAVYHLTEVPMFASRESIVIFDPHTKYLGRSLRDASTPGIRLNIHKNASQIETFKDQFRPFGHVLGFDTKTSYPATLFRLPLRTAQQAIDSEISEKIYNKSEVLELFQILYENADTLLLFTQNVSKVTVYMLNSDIKNLPELNSQFCIERKTLQILRSLLPYNDKPEYEHRVLHVAKSHDDITEKYNCVLQQIIVDGTPIGEARKTETIKSYWVKVGSLGHGDSIKLASVHPDLTSVGGVACKVIRDPSTSKFRPIPLEAKEGLLFCFLPLPIQSNLPVHVNGYFALTSSRSELHWHVETDKSDYRCDWNESLMKDPVCLAYIGLLQEMVRSDIFDHNFLKETIFDVFPMSSYSIIDGQNDYVLCIMKEFFRCMCSESQIYLFPSETEWHNGSSYRALDSSLVNSKLVEKFELTCQIITKRIEDFNFVALPTKFYKCIELCGLKDCIQNQLISVENFYENVFLPHIHFIDKDKTKDLLRFALQNKHLYDVIENNRCIEVVSSKGRILKKPSELIDPTCDMLADLYENKAEVFPVYVTEAVDKHDESELTYWRNVLCQRGMRRRMLIDDDIIERANSIQDLKYETAVKRSNALIRLLDKLDKQRLLEMKSDLIRIVVLVQKEKPLDWSWPWAGETHNTYLTLESYINTSNAEHMGCIVPLVNISVENKRPLHNLLRIYELKFDLTQSQIWEYLKLSTQILQNTEKKLHPKFKKSVEYCYTWLESNDLSFLKNENTEVPIIFLPEHMKMVCPEKCVLQCKYDCSPVIYKLPSHFKTTYKKLTKALKVSYFPCASTLRKYLADIYIANVNTGALHKNKHRVVINVIKCLAATAESDDCSQHFETFLVNDRWEMKECKHLCFHPGEPITESDCSEWLNANITPADARRLGVRTLERKKLDDYSVPGIAFGQREELTNRIKRLLDAYAFDHEIFKEMVQNADDAKATEIKFVLDERVHTGSKIISDKENNRSWRSLQGPSLLIYNNKPFSKNDIIGIKCLGQGSKGHDATTTGKYGVGFNCVYYITDTPTFYSKGQEMGEIICALDPQCQIIPGANSENPGRMFYVKGSFCQDYSDVIKGYKVPFETSEEYTLFRLPLRMNGGDTSTLCNRSVTKEDINSLFDTFIKEVDRILLFLPNISQISIARIKQDGSYENLINVSSNMTAEHKSRKDHFYATISDAAHLLFESTISDIPDKTECYEIDVISSGYTERWLIVQSLGLFNFNDQNNFVAREHKLQKSILLPKGGVAYRLSRNPPLKHSIEIDCGLFCGLPLPHKSYVPMHVNGDFILDSENRHGIFESDDVDSFKGMWNKMLFQATISQAYCEALFRLKESIPETPKCYNDIKETLELYSNALPKIILKELPNMIQHLHLHIYLHLQSTEFIPVIMRKRFETKARNFKSSDEVDIAWKHVHDQVYFARTWPIKETSCYYSASLHNMLLNFRFPFAALPIIYKEVFGEVFKPTINANTGQRVDYVDQRAVAMHIANYNNYIHLRLPCHVKQSPFLTNIAVKETIRYLDGSVKFIASLPLLLTDDAMLHELGQNEVLVSNYSRLFPTCALKFLNKTFTKTWKDSQVFTNILHPFVTHMGIRELELLLPTVLRREVYYNQEEIQMESSKWFETLYEYIETEIHRPENTDGSVCKQWHFDELDILKHWCIVPVLQNGELFLTKFSNTWKIYNPIPFQESLKRLPLPQLDIRLNKCYEVLQHLCPNTSKPYEFLRALENYFSSNVCGEITSEIAEFVLLHLCQTVRELRKHPDSVAQLKQLPVFKTTEGNLQRLHTSAIVVPHIASKRGLFKLSRFIFLENDYQLKPLYEFLSCSYSDFEEFYLIHVLPSLSVFSEDELISHMMAIKQCLEMYPHHVKLLDKLKETAFIMTGNKREKANLFYDPEIKIFCVMNELVPPSPFCDPEWLPFLRRIGLNTVVNDEMCVRYASKIPKYPSSALDRAKYLIKYIYRHYGVKLLMEIRSISFIPVQRVSEARKNVADVQYRCKFTSYDTSSAPEYADISWTVKPLLNRWALPDSEHEQHDLISKPTTLEVVEHLSIVCNKWKGQLEKREETLVLNVQLISCKCYEYLHNTGNLDKAELSKLKEIQGVVSDKGYFYKALQTVDDINKWRELQPHIIRLPDKYFPYKTLMERLGMSESLTFIQIRDVLAQLHRMSYGKDMEPNQLKHAVIATYAAINLLRKNKNNAASCEDSASMDELYLLARNGTLIPSGNLIVADMKCFETRIGKLSEPLLYSLDSRNKLSLKAIKMSAILDAIACLPDRLRPKLLSNIVVEELLPRCLQTNLKIDSPHVLERQLKSKELSQCVLRLLISDPKKPHAEIDDIELLDNISELFRKINVIVLDVVETTCMKDGKPIAGSALSLPYFIVQVGTSINVYVSKHEDIISTALALELSAAIINLYDIFRHCESLNKLLDRILLIPEHEMESFLNDLKIPEHGITVTETDIPEPGEYVCQKYIGMLELAICRLHDKEYVAYEVDDPLLEDDSGECGLEATYIYAQVVRQVIIEGDTQVLLPMYFIYEIDIGNGKKKIVPAFDLYRFSNKKETECVRSVVTADHYASQNFTSKEEDNPATTKRSLQETKKYITETLSDAMHLFKSDIKAWRKVVKRLFLEIHPDKNPEEVQLYTEAFKFLQMQIERVECGQHLLSDWGRRTETNKGSSNNRGRRTETNKGSSSNRGWFHRHSSTFTQRARYHQQQRNTFSGYQHNSRRRNRNNYSTSYHSFSSSSHSYRSQPSNHENYVNPQPGLARRWMQQARFDLQLVIRDQAYQSSNEIPHEWACFMAFQSAKKACMAAQYAVDASKTRPQFSVLHECGCGDEYTHLTQMVGGDEGNWTQYPDPGSYLCIPRQRFTQQDSDRAKELVSQIVTKCQIFIENKQ